MSARCAHGAPWWREDCPGCLNGEMPRPAPPRIDVVHGREWWGWTDGYRYLCGPCGEALEPDFLHECPGVPP